VTYVA